MKKTLLLLLALLLVWPVMAQRQMAKIAILETTSKNKRAPVENAILEQVRSALQTGVKNSGVYMLFSRERIADIMKEHDFQRSGMVSDSEIRKFRFAGVDYILSSTATMSSDGYLVVSGEIINIETGEIMQSVSGTMCRTSPKIAQCCKDIGIYLSKGRDAQVRTKYCDGDGPATGE